MGIFIVLCIINNNTALQKNPSSSVSSPYRLCFSRRSTEASYTSWLSRARLLQWRNQLANSIIYIGHCSSLTNVFITNFINKRNAQLSWFHSPLSDFNPVHQSYRSTSRHRIMLTHEEMCNISKIFYVFLNRSRSKSSPLLRLHLRNGRPAIK